LIDELDNLTDPDQEPVCRWVAKTDEANPFEVDGYDCLSFVSSMISTTADQRIAETYLSLRDSLGDENVGKLPTAPNEVAATLEYLYDGPVADGPLFKAAGMEQKWDIYLYDDRLYFCRSWTGMLTYVAEFSLGDSSLRIPRVWVSGDNAHTTDFAIREIDYLIKSHVYRRQVPHPLPNEITRDPHEVALYSFSQYGNMCCFGTFEDTLPDDLLKWPSIIH
jgi:hypothetical protein